MSNLHRPAPPRLGPAQPSLERGSHPTSGLLDNACNAHLTSTSHKHTSSDSLVIPNSEDAAGDDHLGTGQSSSGVVPADVVHSQRDSPGAPQPQSSQSPTSAATAEDSSQAYGSVKRRAAASAKRSRGRYEADNFGLSVSSEHSFAGFPKQELDKLGSDKHSLAIDELKCESIPSTYLARL